MLPGLSTNVNFKKLFFFFFANGSTVNVHESSGWSEQDAFVFLWRKRLALAQRSTRSTTISYTPRATANQHCMTERWWSHSCIRERHTDPQRKIMIFRSLFEWRGWAICLNCHSVTKFTCYFARVFFDHPAKAAWVSHLTLHCSICGSWTKMNLRPCKAHWITLVTDLAFYSQLCGMRELFCFW